MGFRLLIAGHRHDRDNEAWYVSSKPPWQRWMAARAGATVVEFDDASHAGGYTHYSTRFVKLIEEAAISTAN